MENQLLKYHTNLASYFQSKQLYLDDIEKKKANIRKIVEQPWHLYCMHDPSGLLSFYRNPIIFFNTSNLPDFHIYQEFIVNSLDGEDRIKGLWILFGLHIGNGEDFVSGSNLLLFASQLILNDYMEASAEYIKLCYWIGWSRKKMDDYTSSSFWFLKARKIIIESRVKDCDDYLKWCDEALKEEN